MMGEGPTVINGEPWVSAYTWMDEEELYIELFNSRVGLTLTERQAKQLYGTLREALDLMDFAQNGTG